MKSMLQKLKCAIHNCIHINETTERLVIQNAQMERYKLLSVLSSGKPGIESVTGDFPEIIISLTTYSLRIHNVYIALESLLNQTIKPNRIILWLAEEEFNEANLPISVLRLKERGVEIRFCEDYKSYKKLIPTLREFPEAIIITVDDDVIYPMDLVERLIKAYKKDPGSVHYCRGHRIILNENKKPVSYNNWINNYKGLDLSSLNFPTGIGGILYPPHCFHQDVLREDIFMKLCPLADDIWFKTMSLLNGYYSRKVESYIPFDKEFVDVAYMQHDSLMAKNVYKGKNDAQLKKVFEYYNVYGLFK